MKRIGKFISVILISCLCVSLLTGCSGEVALPYEVMTDNSSFKLITDNAGKANPFANALCVGDTDVALDDYEIEQVGVFCFESRCEEMFDFFNQKLQREGCKTSA